MDRSSKAAQGNARSLANATLISIGETKPGDKSALNESDCRFPQSLNLQRGGLEVDLCLHRHRQQFPEPLGEIPRLEGKSSSGFQTAFVAEIKFGVESEQRLQKYERDLRQATDGVKEVFALGKTVSVEKGEFGNAQAIQNHFLPQHSGVDFDLALEVPDQMLRIEDRQTASGFGQINHADETECWLLIVIMLIMTSLAFIDHPLDLFKVAVQKIHFPRRCLNPGSAIDPRSPLVEADNGWRDRGI